MQLAKRTPGTPLSAAEIRQRRDAARTRWAAAGATTGAFAGITHAALQTPRITADRLRQANEDLTARAARREATIREAVALRLRARQPESSPGVPSGPRVLGNVENNLVYDFQIDELRRRLRRVKAEDAVPIIRDIRQLERLRDRAPTRIVRAGTTRFANPAQAIAAVQLVDRQLVAARTRGATAQEIIELTRLRTEHSAALDTMMEGANVRPTIARQTRQGENVRQRGDRIAAVRSQLNARLRQDMAHLGRRTDHLRALTHEMVIQDIRAAVPGRLARAGLAGAGLGLTAAGIGILADHLLRHGMSISSSSNEVEKMDMDLELAKAGPGQPEDSIAVKLAQTYRRWIDRLLGKTDDPLNLADGVIDGMAPGIIQAFAEGARTPPIDTGSSDPRAFVDVDFDVLNPAVRRHMTEYALDRIVAITESQRAAIRDALLRGPVLQGIGPLEVARTIRQSIGLTPYQTSTVESFRVALMQLDPRALDRKLRDRRFDKTLSRAIETNEPLSGEQINAMVDAYHRRALALRARTIARTEALRATSYGGLARAQEILDEHPELDATKRWLATKDERTRDTHRNLDGQEVDGMQTPFITTAGNQLRWPIDENGVAAETINCRCTLQFVFRPKRGQLMAVAA